MSGTVYSAAGSCPSCALLGANSGNPCLTPRSERQTERGIDSLSRFPIQALVHSWPSRWAQVGLILARRFSRLLRLDGLLADRGAEIGRASCRERVL